MQAGLGGFLTGLKSLSKNSTIRVLKQGCSFGAWGLEECLLLLKKGSIGILQEG